MRSGLKTVGLTDPVPRRTYGVAHGPEEDGDCPELADSDDEGDRRVQATTRARPPLEPRICPVCFAPGISGCYWVKCHHQFARAALPMCGADDPGTGVVIGPSHTVLTEKDKQRFNLHYNRLQACQQRQAEARAQRERRSAPGPCSRCRSPASTTTSTLPA